MIKNRQGIRHRVGRQAGIVCLLLSSLLGYSVNVQAETYRMDLILFVDQYASGGEAGSPISPINLKGALDLDNVGALRAAGIEVLPDAQFGLNNEWQRLRNSKQFKPLLRVAWTQKDPPQERGPSLRIRIGGADEAVPLVDGSVAMLLSHYLHLDANLRYQLDGQSWSLDERRKMKRDEVHHLDSPRLGILTRVTKAGAGPDSAP